MENTDNSQENLSFNDNINSNIDNNMDIHSLNDTNPNVNSNLTEGDKIETKGLKLKKSTKERLNTLQSKFTDAESMVLALLNQYETFTISTDNKYTDRKAEIDKFNFLLDSIKNSFINSLEMATFVEEKYLSKIQEELTKKDKVISIAQNENIKLREEIKSIQKNLISKEQELEDVKDSFSRVNLALTTVEKELKEKSEIIQSLQTHLNTLNKLSNDNDIYQKEISELKSYIKKLDSNLQDYEYNKQLLDNSNKENVKNQILLNELKEENKNLLNYNQELNKKIQNLLLDNSSKILEINEKNNNTIREIEKNKDLELQKANNKINELQEELFKIKLNQSNLK